MAETHPPAETFIPARPSLASLARAARGCTACDLYKRATQAVLGAGVRDAAAFFVGEQPGDQEDLAGKPFVGPAGRVLDECFAEAGIPREEVFVTNAVKHFKWEPRGKRQEARDQFIEDLHLVATRLKAAAVGEGPPTGSAGVSPA